MKRTTRVTGWAGLALSCALACDPGPSAPPPVGGQSGDDGGEHDPGDGPSLPIPPGPPRAPEPPCEPQQASLGAGDATLFGASVQGLLDNLKLGDSTPLFWVPFDGVAPTRFTPGPGQTALTLGVELQPGASATETRQIPDDATSVCPPAVVSLPVRVTLTTADGALAEAFDATLDFANAKVARLVARLDVNALSGSLAFQSIGAPADGYAAELLTVIVDLWPGGSRGWILPEFSRSGPPTPPPLPQQPTPTAAGAPVDSPLVPEHWSALAVWPANSVCPNDGRGGDVVDAAAPLIGVSPLDVLDAVGRDTPWALASAAGDASVRVTLEAPTGLACVTFGGSTLEFDVRATLRADGAAAGSALEHLDASTILRVGGQVAADGSGLVELHWARRDTIWGQARDAFESATGLALDVPAEYRDIWWSWEGVETRPDTKAAWSARAALSVSSLNTQQAADTARQVAQGGPGASIGPDADGFTVLPGDALLDAASSQ